MLRVCVYIRVGTYTTLLAVLFAVFFFSLLPPTGTEVY